MELQTADARYEKTWHQFLSELGRHPTLRLAAYLRYKHVYHRGFEKWMYRNGYSVHAAKDRLLSLRMETVATENPEAPGFLPVLPSNQQESGYAYTYHPPTSTYQNNVCTTDNLFSLKNS